MCTSSAREIREGAATTDNGRLSAHTLTTLPTEYARHKQGAPLETICSRRSLCMRVFQDYVLVDLDLFLDGGVGRWLKASVRVPRRPTRKQKMREHRKLTRTGTPSARPVSMVSQDHGGKLCRINTRTCTKRLKAGTWKKQQSALGREGKQDEGRPRKGNQNERPRKIGPLGNPFEEHHSCLGRSSGSYRAKMWNGITSREQCALWLYLRAHVVLFCISHCVGSGAAFFNCSLGPAHRAPCANCA